MNSHPLLAHFPGRQLCLVELDLTLSDHRGRGRAPKRGAGPTAASEQGSLWDQGKDPRCFLPLELAAPRISTGSTGAASAAQMQQQRSPGAAATPKTFPGTAPSPSHSAGSSSSNQEDFFQGKAGS